MLVFSILGSSDEAAVPSTGGNDVTVQVGKFRGNALISNPDILITKWKMSFNYAKLFLSGRSCNPETVGS
jgi:hypothetical protein